LVQAITMAAGSVKLHRGSAREFTELLGFRKARLNAQEAPAPTVLLLDSKSDGVIDGSPSSSAATAGIGMAEVIILMTPA
jgi:hypothetical protein